MLAQHLRVDAQLIALRAQASHDSHCPDLGPICAVRAEPPQQHHTTLWLSELRVWGEYGLLDWLGVQAMFPLRLADTRTRYTDLQGRPLTLDYPDIHHRDQTLVGPGDPQLMLHAATRLAGVNVGGRLGVSVPLGVVHANPFRLGALGLEHQHLQFGTGSVDPVLSLDASTAAGPFMLSAFAFAQVPLYAGRNGFQAGARLFSGFNVAVPVGPASLRVGMSVFNEWAERWDGVVPAEDGNQGRTDLYVVTGLTVPFGDDGSVSFDLRARAHGAVKNAQLDLPLVAELSVGRLFHLESGTHGEPAVAPAPGAGADVEDAVVGGVAAPLVPASGKWTVFDFWASWCEACQEVDRELRAWAARDGRLAVRRVDIVDFDSPIARQELSGVAQLPYLRLVSPEGDVLFDESGPADVLLARLRVALERSQGGEAGWACPMHPNVRAREPGACRECGMPLEPRR